MVVANFPLRIGRGERLVEPFVLCATRLEVCRANAVGVDAEERRVAVLIAVVIFGLRQAEVFVVVRVVFLVIADAWEYWDAAEEFAARLEQIARPLRFRCPIVDDVAAV